MDLCETTAWNVLQMADHPLGLPAGVPRVRSVRNGRRPAISPVRYSGPEVRPLWLSALAGGFLPGRRALSYGPCFHRSVYSGAGKDLVRVALSANGLYGDGLSKDRMVDRWSSGNAAYPPSRSLELRSPLAFRYKAVHLLCDLVCDRQYLSCLCRLERYPSRLHRRRAGGTCGAIPFFGNVHDRILSRLRAISRAGVPGGVSLRAFYVGAGRR